MLSVSSPARVMERRESEARVVVIRNCADLAPLEQPRKSRGSFCVALEIPGIPTPQAARWESDLNAALRECGCSWGEALVVAAVAMSVLWQEIYQSWALLYLPAFLVRTTLAMITAGILGKRLGLWSAQLKLRRTCSRIVELCPDWPGEEAKHVHLHKAH